jgi:hypothetical protein
VPNLGKFPGLPALSSMRFLWPMGKTRSFAAVWRQLRTP